MSFSFSLLSFSHLPLRRKGKGEKWIMSPHSNHPKGGGGSDARLQSLSHYARMCESAFLVCSSNTANSQKIVVTSVDFSSYLDLNMKFKVFTLSSLKLFAKAPTGCDLWHLGWKNPSSSSVVSPLAAPVINFPPITTYYAKRRKRFFPMRVGYLRKNVNIELYFVTQRKWFNQMCFPAGEQDPNWQ